MANNQNDLDYQNEAYHEIKTSRFQAFKNFFNRQKALPESSESKHRTTNVNMKTSMNIISFRASIIEKVGNFFQSLSKLTTPKKEENLNKFATEIVGTQSKDATIERTRDNDESAISQQPRYFPGNISVKSAHSALTAETIIIAETNNEPTLDHDSIDTGSILVDKDFITESVVSSEKPELTSTTITVANNQDISQNAETQQKKVIVPKSSKKVGRDDSNIR